LSLVDQCRVVVAVAVDHNTVVVVVVDWQEAGRCCFGYTLRAVDPDPDPQRGVDR